MVCLFRYIKWFESSRNFFIFIFYFKPHAFRYVILILYFYYCAKQNITSYFIYTNGDQNTK
jgi:hypothetical protein